MDDASPAAADDRIVVHLPRSWRKLRQLVEHGERKGGDFVPRYVPRCNDAVKCELPENVVVCRDTDDGWYFSAGPHPRYYRLCGDCAELGQAWSGVFS